MFSWSQMQSLGNKGAEEVDQLRDASRSCKLNLFEQFYLFLHRLPLGSFNQELADKFNISISTVGRVILFWTNFLYFVFGTMPIWPTREKIQKSLMLQKSRQRHHQVQSSTVSYTRPTKATLHTKGTLSSPQAVRSSMSVVFLQAPSLIRNL